MSGFCITRRDGSQHEVLVDDSDLADVAARGPWRIAVCMGKHYVVRGNRPMVYLHRFLLSAGAEHVDHINGNGLDNRRCNLRLATRNDNQHNRGKQKNNTSGYKGVHWDKKKARWMARIGVSGKMRFLGYFDSAYEGHLAYCAAAAEMHGEFARIA